jgi:predicted dehydrogenase
MSKVKLGIIGLGNMGQVHCKLVSSLADFELTAVADNVSARREKMQAKYQVAGFDSGSKLIASRGCDAVLIATPHYDHTQLGCQALRHGCHVMIEKPISVDKLDALRLVKAHDNPEQVFAAMFNQRTHPAYQQLRHWIQSGEFGAVKRVQWTITDWFRTQAYYDSGDWRATWAGEGGGVLLNQCPHQLDLICWLFGLPVSLYSQCSFGKYHHLEVEDEVTCLLNFEQGATGVFTTTTGEAPGINRLEIAFDEGLVTYDSRDDFITSIRNEKSVTRAIRENAAFEKPATTKLRLPVEGDGGQHRAILENFAAAILRGETLISPASDGLRSVELANAMLLSGWTRKAVSLPINARGYRNRLTNKIKGSTFVREVKTAGVVNMADSF